MKIKRITLEIIPHNEQRYDTVGDYWEEPDGWAFRVSDLGDTTFELAVFVHELLEKSRCATAGVSNDSIDKFDMEYDYQYEEPGIDPEAPYFDQHAEATIFERLWLALHEGNWKEYEQSFLGLEYKKGVKDGA